MTDDEQEATFKRQLQDLHLAIQIYAKSKIVHFTQILHLRDDIALIKRVRERYRRSRM